MQKALPEFDVLSPHTSEALERAFAVYSNMGSPPGNYLEFGLYQGHSLLTTFNLIRRYQLDEMRLFGFDSFEGLPKPHQQEERVVDQSGPRLVREGDLSCSKSDVMHFLTSHGADLDRITLIEGFYEDSLTEELQRSIGIREAAIVLVDCDLYSSTVDVLRMIEPFVRDRTLLLFDDWNLYGAGNSTNGQPLAFHEYLARNPHVTAEPLFPFGWHGQSFVLNLDRPLRGRARRSAGSSRLDRISTPPVPEALAVVSGSMRSCNRSLEPALAGSPGAAVEQGNDLSEQRTTAPGLHAVLTRRWSIEQCEEADRQQWWLIHQLLPGLAGHRVLDLGCGIGRLTRRLSRDAALALGVDRSHPMLRRAVITEASACDDTRRDRYLQGTVVRLPFADRSFDVVLAVFVLQHLASDDVFQDTLAEISRIVRQPGWLIAVDGKPNPTRLRTDSPTTPRLLEDFRSLENRFELRERIDHSYFEDLYKATLWTTHDGTH